jgi:predicted CoA-substrate-specific enzyme activase
LLQWCYLTTQVARARRNCSGSLDRLNSRATKHEMRVSYGQRFINREFPESSRMSLKSGGMEKKFGNRRSTMIFAGVDVGSLSAEAVLMNESSGILAYKIIVVKPNPVTSATLVMDSVLEQQGLAYDDISFCVSTGYGRERLPFANHNISEISCHGKGAHWVDPSIRTIIDVGGQDCKVIRIDSDGHLKDFVMNDKCAAGTGRFLEGIAKTLEVDINDLGDLSLGGTDPVHVSSICTVFTQFDVLCLLAEGRKQGDIGLGVAEALASRVMRLVNRVGIEETLCITGGVAKNKAVVKSLEKVTGHKIIEMAVDSQIIGALGAALFAKERYFSQQAASGGQNVSNQ